MYPDIKTVGFKHEKITEVLALLENVYLTSGSMSESFSEKFPNSLSCQNYFENILGKPGGIVLFAEIKGQLAGYIVVDPRYQANLRHTADLNMGVKTGFRGKHVGTTLLSKSLEMSKKSGIIEIIYLMVRADNYPALQMYENSGFEKLATLHRDTKISGNYYDGILMRKFI